MNYLKQALEDILEKRGRQTRTSPRPNSTGYDVALFECQALAREGIEADTGQESQAKMDAGTLILFITQMGLSDDLIKWLELQLDGEEDEDYQRMLDNFQAKQPSKKRSWWKR